MSEGTAAPAGKKKSKKGLLLGIVAFVLLAGGGAGGFFWWKGQQAAEASAKKSKSDHDDSSKESHGEDEEAAAEVSGALPFEPFIVNLADPGASRYLKADVSLLVSEADDVKHLAEDEVVMLRLRSAILEHLSQQTSDQIATPEGKDALKKAIAERSDKILGHHAKVADVLFNEFVVQF